MNKTFRNALIIFAVVVICILVQQIMLTYAKHLPPLMVRFVQGWGLAVSVGVVASLLLLGTRVQRLLMMLCVPVGWLVWYFVFDGVAAGAERALLLYTLYSLGFMLVGFVLAEWYRHSSSVSRRP